MQTFLPYASFEDSLRCLDYRRLGKQRVEAKQIVLAISGSPSRWNSHPAVNMWRPFIGALAYYYNLAIQIWIEKGYKNSMVRLPVPSNFTYPTWFGNQDFHAAHRSNLLRKNRLFYQQYGWNEPDNLEYIWPVL